MTEEQYEKINKNAENYLNTTTMSNPIRISSVRNAYIAGATENGIQWHDLRKDPNDLPKEDCEVFAIVESDGTLYKSVENYYLDKTDTFDGWGTCQKIIAWFDPQFKE